jgi:hypothetical protein
VESLVHLQQPSYYDPTVVPEAPLEQTEAGLVPAGEGWFVLNARDGPWRHQEGRGELRSPPWRGRRAETDDVDEAYARLPEHKLTRYRDGWLPD